MSQQLTTKLGGWLPPSKGSYFNKELSSVVTFLLFVGLLTVVNANASDSIRWVTVGLVAASTFALGRAVTTWWEISRAASETRKQAILIDHRAEDEIRRYGELRKQTINAVHRLVPIPHVEFIRASQFLFGVQTTYMESTLKNYALAIDSLSYNSSAHYSSSAFLSEKRQRIAQIDQEVAELLAALPQDQALMQIFSGALNRHVVEKVLDGKKATEIDTNRRPEQVKQATAEREVA
jgi:hypothetical protein